MTMNHNDIMTADGVGRIAAKNCSGKNVKNEVI